ncbi:MAG: plasmid stability protein StbA, partial [Halioglobus sp.]|nr:plasmid stability protein StbA [Halioglobus sp.]
MNELTDQKVAKSDLPTKSINATDVGQAGLDDGYAYTKVALPDGRLIAVPSRARMGSAGVTWIHE